MLSTSRPPPRIRTLLLALVATIVLPSRAAPANMPPAGARADAAPVTWGALWIAPAGNPDRPNSWLALRHQFELEAAPVRATVRIAASDKYWLWINGELAVFEGQLKRGPNPDDTYFDTIDLAPYLRAGTNTIAALVWYWGRSGYSHRSTGRAGFLFDGDVDGVPVVSDSGWRARTLPAYRQAAGPQPSTALTEQHVIHDARLAIPGWREPEFDDTGWPRALELGAPPTSPWNELVERPVPMWRDQGLRDYTSITGMPSGDEGGRVVAHLPYNAQVTPYLEVDAPAGATIDIRTDTYNTSDVTTLRAEYTTRAGVQEYESYGWLSGHEVHYTIPPGVRVLELKYRETGYDADFEGSFQSDDPSLDVLWQKARRTLYVNMRDNHMDCPDRERAQWFGDMVVQHGQVFYALDAQRGPLLARKGWRQMAAWQRADDALVTPVPYGRGMNSPELPLQMLASVGWYGLWTYYRYTGDAATLEETYPGVRDYLSLWEIGADGLVVHRAGDWTWPDWGDHTDYPILENAWYYLALKGALEMARVTGAEGDIPGYESRMRSIRNAFRRAFWRGDHFRSRDHDGAIDDRANAMAVLAGLARPNDHPAILRVLEREEHASPYMEKYVLEAMFMIDGAAQAMERMKRRYRPQIESWVTTLWEDWEWQAWNGYNHAWAGGPLTLLSRYAAGVEPARPGYEEFSLFPRLGILDRVEASVPTPRGTIELGVERDTSDVRLTLRSAPMPGTIGIPTNLQHSGRLTVNGIDLWRDGAPTGGAEAGDSAGVRLISVDEQWARVRVPAGSWSIEAVGGGSVPDSHDVFNLSENPIRSGSVTFNFRDRPSVAAVFTLDGRQVVDLTRRLTEPLRMTWDLTNDRGVHVAPGVYLFVARIGDVVVRRRLVVPRGSME